MIESPVQKPVHVAYSPIAFMNYQWTINLHDGYPLLQGMQPEEQHSTMGSAPQKLIGVIQRRTYRNAQVHIKWMYAHGS